jgi:hypothetical protein
VVSRFKVGPHNPTLTPKSPMTAASPLTRYGAIEERARERPCYRQLHHRQGHDPSPRRMGGRLGPRSHPSRRPLRGLLRVR